MRPAVSDSQKPSSLFASHESLGRDVCDYKWVCGVAESRPRHRGIQCARRRRCRFCRFWLNGREMSDTSQHPLRLAGPLAQSCKIQCCSVRERSTAQRAHCKSPAHIRIGEWPRRGLRGGEWLGGESHRLHPCLRLLCILCLPRGLMMMRTRDESSFGSAQQTRGKTRFASLFDA